MSAGRACVVLVSAPSAEVAAALAHTLVAERLAACASILPGVRSIYRWEGSVRDEPETLLLLKTTAGALPALTQRTVALHPYELPEVLALPVTGGLEAYLGWVEESTRQETQ